MHLVPDWRQAWRWFSVQALAIIMVLPLVWAGLPADVKAWVPPEWHIPIIMLLGAGGIAGRLVDQNKPKEPTP